jgi:hypothetical protein
MNTYQPRNYEGGSAKEELTHVQPKTVKDAQSASKPLLKYSKHSTEHGKCPTHPQTVKNDFLTAAPSLLLVCAIGFLAFALIVNQYNQAPTSENPQATKRLQSASKYVSRFAKNVMEL